MKKVSAFNKHVVRSHVYQFFHVCSSVFNKHVVLLDSKLVFLRTEEMMSNLERHVKF